MAEEQVGGKKHRTYDDVFDHVQSFGGYQRWLYFGIKVVGFSISMNFTAMVFCMGTPLFQCTTPNTTCPPRKCCDNCTSYEFQGPFTTTVSEWNLICDRGYMGASLQASYFMGMLVGSLLVGPISDTWGRKICIFSSYAIMLVAGLGTVYADCLSLFGLLRFVVGFSLAGCMLSSFVYTMELVGPQWRTVASTLTGCFVVTNNLAGLLIAYYIREWRLLLLVYTLPSIVPVLLWKVFPESPRWLLLNGRIDEAMALLMKYRAKKGQPIDTEAFRNLLVEICQDQKGSAEKEKKYSHLDLVRTKKLRKYSAIMSFEWFTVAFTAFGIFLYLSQLAGNIYANYAIFDAFGFMSVLVDMLLLPRFGRRIVLAIYCFMGGTALLIIQLVYQDFPLLATGLCLFAVILGPSWNGVYLITAELYPTVLRNTGVGSGSMCARIGGILAPYFTMTAQLPGLNLTFPVTVFGVTSLIAGVLYFFLPETLFTKMHQTIEQTESAKDDYGLVCCGKPLRRKDGLQAPAAVSFERINGVVLTNVVTERDEKDVA